MQIIQLLIIILAAFLIGRTLVKFQRQKLDLKQTIFWIIVWTILLVISIIPGIMGVPASILGIERAVDSFVYLGIVALFYITFLFYSKLDELREKTSKIIRLNAIQQAEIEELTTRFEKFKTLSNTANKIIAKKTTKTIRKTKPAKRKSNRKK